MAVTRPINSAARIAGASLLGEGPWTAAFLLSAVFYRSFDVITLPGGEGAQVLQPGDFVTADGSKASAAGDIIGISMRAYDPTDGPVDAVLVTRDAEVTDAYLLYGELDAAEVNAALKEHGIIVRAAVLPESIQAGFGTPGTPATP
jgi:hypothetical protein